MTRLFFALVLLWSGASLAQQNVHVPVKENGRTLQLASRLYRPAGQAPEAAVAIFHGCGSPGQNTERMAALLQSWGYVALSVDSFSARGLKDVCGRNWPTQADAETRAHDIDAAVLWLKTRSFVDANRVAFMGYSYGGGVAMLHTFSPTLDGKGDGVRAAILVYPDCDLADALGAKLRVQQPLMLAIGALDDWTPVSRCQAILDKVVVGRDLVETHVYAGAYHSFDALGLPVRYLKDVGNRSKPGGCCGAHYGANEAAWKAFVSDVRLFLAKNLEP